MSASAARLAATTDGRPQSAEIAGLAALVTGDEAGFMSVVESWSASLLRLASWVGGQASAERLVRGAWVRTLAQLSELGSRPPLRVWLCGMLLDDARATGVISGDPASYRQPRAVPIIDPHRFRRAEDEWPGNWARPPGPWPDSDGLAQSLADFDLDGAVARLPEAERVVLSLRDGAGCDIDQITGLLAITPEQTRGLLNAARAGVRDALEAHLLSGASV